MTRARAVLAACCAAAAASGEAAGRAATPPRALKEKCDPTSAVYWATDYTDTSEFVLLSMPLALRSAALYYFAARIFLW